MTEFAQGQRWVVDSEPELGLGLVVDVDLRAVTIWFELAKVQRQYAKGQVPLTRIRFEINDEIELVDGSKARVTQVYEREGIIVYETGVDQLVAETRLSSNVNVDLPVTRLLTGQVDHPRWFYLRRKLDHRISRLWQARLNGMLGARTNIIPHQLYVAWQACERENVRVLLADEVGLGKTIEAGIILSRLIKLERIARVIIFVPDALQVQWLVELIRKFNLRAELYRGMGHEFELGQIHIAPFSCLSLDAQRLQAAHFDLVVIDEAHHLQIGTEEFNNVVKLGQDIKHLLLLTATPEQLGIKGHFERLKLLDPAKFNCFEQFKQEEDSYVELNKKIRMLPDSRNDLISQYQLDRTLSQSELIDKLLDCHGIGRVMFRNVRKAVRGFPKRLAIKHLIQEDNWQEKFEWLGKWLNKNKDEKVLVITHSIDQVKACELYLWQKHGIDSAIFHEDQTLLERDKAAAYFADPEKGSQILLCSEIGSEGRNFQFSRHLVCLDLPDHPDLLEQRIGRLDRIGQKGDIKIHVPMAPDSPTMWLFEWYHDVLDCIEQQRAAAGLIHEKYWHLFPEGANFGVIKEARKEIEVLENEIQNGRDALLELNSCRQPLANDLAHKITDFERYTPYEIVEIASDLFQFYFEQLSPGIYSLIPSDKMLIPALPGIPAEGVEVTFSREIAVSREDLFFITWDSPFVEGLWDLLHQSELGSASVAMLPHSQLPAGHCLLETHFEIVIKSQYSVDCLPFMENRSVRVLLLDAGEKDLSDSLADENLDEVLKPVKKHIAREIIQSQKNKLGEWYKKAEQQANRKQRKIATDSYINADHFYKYEIQRLQQMKKSNPHVSDGEISALEEKRVNVLNAFESHSHLHVSAVRLIVITPVHYK